MARWVLFGPYLFVRDVVGLALTAANLAGLVWGRQLLSSVGWEIDNFIFRWLVVWLAAMGLAVAYVFTPMGKRGPPPATGPREDSSTATVRPNLAEEGTLLREAQEEILARRRAGELDDELAMHAWQKAEALDAEKIRLVGLRNEGALSKEEFTAAWLAAEKRHKY